LIVQVDVIVMTAFPIWDAADDYGSTSSMGTRMISKMPHLVRLALVPAWYTGDGITARDLRLYDVENALFLQTEVMPTGLEARLAGPRRGWDLKVSQKLQVARNLVAQGWTTGALVSLGIDGRYRYCARGALNKAFLGRATTDAEFRPDDEFRFAQRLVAEAMLGQFLSESDPTAVRQAIYTWNDSQVGWHAQARVVAAFDAAIAECKRLEDAEEAPAQ
jgi:hypothetical protein